MNNKDFISELASRTGLNIKETQQRMNFLIQEMADHLCSEDTIAIHNFGTFETKKRLERVLISPSGQRMLIPPKIVVSFKQHAALKEKIQ